MKIVSCNDILQALLRQSTSVFFFRPCQNVILENAFFRGRFSIVLLVFSLHNGIRSNWRRIKYSSGFCPTRSAGTVGKLQEVKVGSL